MGPARAGERPQFFQEGSPGLSCKWRAAAFASDREAPSSILQAAPPRGCTHPQPSAVTEEKEYSKDVIDSLPVFKEAILDAFGAEIAAADVLLCSEQAPWRVGSRMVGNRVPFFVRMVDKDLVKASDTAQRAPA